jgi:Secretion system C-terminal sorting domain
MNNFYNLKHIKMNILKINIIAILLCILSTNTNAQTLEWRLTNALYSAVDPDGAGPATGSVTFKLQIHATTVSIPDITGISVGWSYQSAAAMIPTGLAGPGCVASANNPANVTIGAGIFNTGAFLYTAVNQCAIPATPQVIGANSYDRRTIGSLEGNPITITTAWADIYTVTLWTLGTTYPQGGYVFINSGAGGSPNPVGSYAVSNLAADEFVANSLTNTTPLALGTSVVPVTFSKFEANCNDKGIAIEWATSQEINSENYQIEKSFDGANWKSIATIKAVGNSSTVKEYNYLDLNAGVAKYRIKQVDMDGRFTYTSIKTTYCTPKNIDIAIYPVPAKDKLNVAISSNKNINTNFVIYDATGRIVKQLTQKITVGNNALQIDVTNLPNGQYILRSTDEVLNINKKFTILK